MILPELPDQLLLVRYFTHRLCADADSDALFALADALAELAAVADLNALPDVAAIYRELAAHAGDLASARAL